MDEIGKRVLIERSAYNDYYGVSHISDAGCGIDNQPSDGVQPSFSVRGKPTKCIEYATRSGGI